MYSEEYVYPLMFEPLLDLSLLVCAIFSLIAQEWLSMWQDSPVRSQLYLS